MKITAIKAQLKRSDRFSVFIDGQYAFSLSGLELSNRGLIRGMELTKAEIKDLKIADNESKLFERTLKYVLMRPRSRWEMEQYLNRKKVSPETTESILNMLIDRKYLDDKQFADTWVANRRLLKPTSRRRLHQELKQKRVADSIIDDVLTEDSTSDRDVLSELIARKRRIPKFQDNQKLMQYLARQGYSYDDIRNAFQTETE